MSHSLDDLIAAELRQLHLLIEPRRPLIARSLHGHVELETLDALSALLHAFYTAIERILLHIAKREGIYDAIQSKASLWHSVLLTTIADDTEKRRAIISAELHHHLKEYLGFRHVFRHAYLHELKWTKMRGLVENLDKVLGMFENEIDAYLDRESE